MAKSAGVTLQREQGGFRGRPLDRSLDVAIHEATLSLLADIGYDRLSIDAVAAKAKVSKVTIYRRWSGKVELVVDAVSSLKEAPSDFDTGSLADDLEQICERAASTSAKFDAHLMIGLITALASDHELRTVYRKRLVSSYEEGVRKALLRAVERGEISEEVNIDLLASVFPAMTIHHLVTTGKVPDRHFRDQVMHQLLLPIARSSVPAHQKKRAEKNIS